MFMPLSWIKRHYLLTASIVAVIAVITLLASWRCPVCGGIVVPPRLIARWAAAEPSKNLAIWNGSYHGPGYEYFSAICTRCWMAHYADWDDRWERASEFPDSFRRPLSTAIRQVPLPPRERIHERVVYMQSVKGTTFMETVLFWCDNSPDVVAPLEAYARAHNLIWRTSDSNREPEKICVHLQTQPTL